MLIEYRWNNERLHWTATTDAQPGLRGRGIKLNQARHQLLRRLSLSIDAPGLDEMVHLPELEQAAYAQYLTDLENMKALEAAVRAARIALVKRFNALHLTLKDSARLLRLSPPYLAELASQDDAAAPDPNAHTEAASLSV